MINFVEHKNIDKQKWDVCVNGSQNFSVFALSWYLDSVCKNWSALVLGDYKAVMPIVVGSKLSLQYVYQPNFTRYFSVYSSATSNKKMINDFFEAIPKSVKYIEFNVDETILFDRTDFEKKEKLFQVLNLNQSYESLFESFKGDAKRNIKKAEKNNLVITNNVLPEQVVDLFRNNKGKELKGLTNDDYNSLNKLMVTALKNDAGIIVGALNTEHKLIAAGFFIKTDKTILFLKGSANSEGKASGAMYLILNFIFKNYAQKINEFDFGGSSVESVASFNKNFAAKDCVYLHLKKNNLPRFIKLISGKK